MNRGYLFIAIATVMFGTFEVALKYIAGEVNSVQLTFTRFFIGFLFLAPLAWRTLKKRGLSVSGRDLGYFALLGLVGIALCMPIYQLSVNYTDSGVVAVLFSCNPVFVTFLAFLFLGEPVRGRHVAALVLEVAGTVAIINPFETRLNMVGVALTLAATILFAIYGVMGKKKVAQFGGPVVTCLTCRWCCTSPPGWRASASAPILWPWSTSPPASSPWCTSSSPPCPRCWPGPSTGRRFPSTCSWASSSLWPAPSAPSCREPSRPRRGSPSSGFERPLPGKMLAKRRGPFIIET